MPSSISLLPASLYAGIASEDIGFSRKDVEMRARKRVQERNGRGSKRSENRNLPFKLHSHYESSSPDIGIVYYPFP